MAEMRISVRDCLLILSVIAVQLAMARLKLSIGMLLLVFLPGAVGTWAFCALRKIIKWPMERIVAASLAGGIGTFAVMTIHITFFFVPAPNFDSRYWDLWTGLYSAYGCIGGFFVGCVGEFCLYCAARVRSERGKPK